MEDIWLHIQGWFTKEHFNTLLRCGFLLLVAFPLVMAVSGWLRRIVTRRFSAQQGMVTGKCVRYIGIVIILLVLFRELGFSLTPLLGAAGIAGVALAFASQTSVSNIISGIFLIAEEPFQVGDVIAVGTTTGVVLSIDTLSVKLRTFDNRFVRIPNETLIKTEVTNNSRFPIRRIDLQIGVAYKEDMKRVREVLLEVAKADPLCLMEPVPLIVMTGFGQSSIDFLFGVWVAKENFIKVKNSIQDAVKIRFDEEGIEIPFPHLTLYSGSVTAPFPVAMQASEPGDATS